MGKVFRQIIVFIVLAVSLQGCANAPLRNIFSGYSDQMGKTRLAQRSGDFAKASRLTPSGNKGLTALEKGRLQYLANDLEKSQQSFASVYDHLEDERAKAKIQVSKGLRKVGALVTNDNVINYQIPAYEQSMMHSYQALNYLYQGSMEGALVEIRRANLVQELALKQNQDDLYEAQENLLKKANVSMTSLQQHYPSMAAVIGDVKNGFQNAYVFYLSAVLYEAGGELNDAYIDYKRALEIFSDNVFLQQDVLRLATKLDMADDLVGFEQRFGKYQPVALAASGQVVVLYEQGLVKEKSEIALRLPISTSSGDLRFYSVALPVYKGGLAPIKPVVLTLDDKTLKSAEIVRIQSLASKQLKEQMPGIVARQVLRLISKEQMRKTISEKAGDVGNVLAGLYSLVSEKADTRSWLTLPENTQILRASLAPGKQRLNMTVAGQVQQIDVEVQADRITLINLTSVGSYVGYRTINL